MKCLIDPIYTNEVNRCASAVKMKSCVEYFLQHNVDLFIYWFVPKVMNEEEKNWLPKDERIKYIALDYFEDRFKEYWHTSDEYRRLISFNGWLWDIDLVLTNRTSLVPFIRWAVNKPTTTTTWSKRILLMEDMPIMSFKMFIPQYDDRVADSATILGYLSAHKTCIAAYWEKKRIIEEARKYYSASSVRYLQENIVEATSRIQSSPKLKDPQFIKERKGKFTISYAGRMLNQDCVDDSFDAMLNNWILGGDDIRLILCTVSKNFGRVRHEITDVLEVLRPNREEFWRIMREESHVGIFMSRDEEYSMSMMEPLMNGTPLVIYRAEHAVASVGADYPFFVDSIKEGYAFLRKFKAEYAEMYEKFAQWSKKSFVPLISSRNEQYIPAIFHQEVKKWREGFGSASEALKNNEIVQLIAHVAPQQKSFLILDVLKEVEKSKALRSKISWKEEKQFENLRLGFSSHFDSFRLGLMKLGFEDAGPEAGFMQRV